MTDEKKPEDSIELEMIREFKQHFVGGSQSLLDANRDGFVDMDDVRHVLVRFEWIIVSGLLLFILPLLNLAGVTYLPGDFFWSLAGFCLTIEGIIEIWNVRKAAQFRRSVQ